MRTNAFKFRKNSALKRIIIALILCIGAIFMFHTTFITERVVDKVRVFIYDADVRLGLALERIGVFCEGVGRFFSDDTRNLLIKLQTENLELRYKIKSLQQLEHENDVLRKLLDMKTNEKVKFITARILTIFANDFSRNCLINVGADQQVEVNDAVVNDEGLVGRIIEVGKNWSKVLLITDFDSKIPVKIGEKGVNAIIGGDNSNYLRITIVHEDTHILEKQTVVTSRYGGVFQEGIKVGETINRGDKMVVKPSVDFNSIIYVNVLKRHADN